jgi:hypothetical protein
VHFVTAFGVALRGPEANTQLQRARRSIIARGARSSRVLASGMRVIFQRTGERRYAVVVAAPGEAAQTMNPAPGFDPNIPHDLVHYVVEAELGFDAGVFGRAARGAGTFYGGAASGNAREQARMRRKQARRELALRRETANEEQLATSERLAALCDVAWRRRHGQRAEPAGWHSNSPVSVADAACIERVVSRLDELAPLWNQLPVGGELAFTWPGLAATVQLPRQASAS